MLAFIVVLLLPAQPIYVPPDQVDAINDLDIAKSRPLVGEY